MKVSKQIDLDGNRALTNEPIDRNSLADLLYNIINSMSLEEFIKTITNEFRETIEYINLQKGFNTCQNTTLLFNPTRLDTRTKSSKMSVYQAFKSRDFIDGLSRAILFDKQYYKNKDYLFYVLRLGINGVQYVNEFQAYVARDLCIKYKLDTSSRVLDPCGGWGGRMLGVSVISNYYECYEPESRTFDGLLKLSQFIKNMNPNFRTKINGIPFEDAELSKNSFDFAITSPPYYDTEIYSEESTNSMNRYKSFESWKTNFYIPLIENTMNALKPKCSFILNIGSRNYPLNKILYENFDKKYKIEKLGNYLSGSQGLGKSGEGEMFYCLTSI